MITLSRIKKANVKVKCYQTLQDGKLLLVGDEDGALSLYERIQVKEKDVGFHFRLLHTYTLHYGPINSIDISSTFFAVTGGHDGACCAVYLEHFFRVTLENNNTANGGKRKVQHRNPSATFSRFTHYTLPAIEVHCFSDGNSFASLSVDGNFAIQEIGGNQSLLFRVSCGFPCRCFSLSFNETFAVIGGTQCAVVFFPHTTGNSIPSFPGVADKDVRPLRLVDAGGEGMRCLPEDQFIHSVSCASDSGRIEATLAKFSAEHGAPVCFGVVTWPTLASPGEWHASEEKVQEDVLGDFVLDPTFTHQSEPFSWVRPVCLTETPRSHLLSPSTSDFMLKGEKEKIQEEINYLAAELKNLLASRKDTHKKNPIKRLRN